MPVPISKTAITNGCPVSSFSIGKYVCSLLLYSLIVLPCLSQPIGIWRFNGALTGTGGAYNSASTADFSAGIPTRSFNSGMEYFGENGWPAGALDPNSYLQFSVTPNTGYQVDISSIVLRIRRSNTGTPAGSGPTSWALRSSIDGYASNIGSNSLSYNYALFTVNPGSSFLNQYSTVTFRLYGFNSSAPADGRHRFVVDSIAINGIGEVLPVNFTGIKAFRTSNDVTVKWQMNNVQEGTRFNVQRSTNGIDYTNLNNFTEVEYKTTNAYNYLDDHVPVGTPLLYYRIQSTLPSGKTILSPIVKISSKAATQALIDYTAIQGQSLLTALQTPAKGRYTLSLISLNGAILQQRSIELDAGVNVITLPLNALAHGTYIVRLVNNKLTSTRKFVW